MSKTMKCCRFTEKGGNLQVETVPVPEAKKGEVRIQVKACGVCHSDLIIKHGLAGNPFPRIPGHEVAGIDVVGEGVTKYKKGDKVGVGWFGGHCGACKSCLQNEWVCCEKGQICGASYDGGYAEYIFAPEDALARIPEELSFEEAAPLLCAGITVFNAIRHQGLVGGDLVAIQGVGGLGHLAVQFAAKFGYKVAVISSGSDKEKLAKQLGAHVYINGSATDPAAELSKLGGAKLIVATAPNPKVIEPLIKGLSVGGKLLILAALGAPLTINTLDMLMKKQSIVCWPSGDSRDSEDTLNFANLTGVKAQIEKFPLEKAQEALERMETSKARFRCVLTM